MEKLLEEILYELKGIRKEIRVAGNNPNPLEMKLMVGEDVIVEKVVDSINKEMKKQGRDLTLV